MHDASPSPEICIITAWHAKPYVSSRGTLLGLPFFTGDAPNCPQLTARCTLLFMSFLLFCEDSITLLMWLMTAQKPAPLLPSWFLAEELLHCAHLYNEHHNILCLPAGLLSKRDGPALCYAPSWLSYQRVPVTITIHPGGEVVEAWR